MRQDRCEYKEEGYKRLDDLFIEGRHLRRKRKLKFHKLYADKEIKMLYNSRRNNEISF